MAPVRAGNVSPPVETVSKIYRPARSAEDNGGRNQHFRRSTRIVFRFCGTFRESDIFSRVDKSAPFVVGDGTLIHPEAIYRHLMDRTFLRVVVFRTHEKGSSGNPNHGGMRRSGWRIDVGKRNVMLVKSLCHIQHSCIPSVW